MSPGTNIDLAQTWPRPSRPLPIVMIGAGDIVRDGHLPAYAKAGYEVAGVFDLDAQTAYERARDFKVGEVYDSMEAATADPGVVYDVATPPKAHTTVLEQLPIGATVLIQKPMGRTMGEAQAILELCRRKKFKAAVNFQLRFSPQMLAIRDFIRKGGLGEIVDIEMHLNLQTPWNAFPFLLEEERVEILIHSVHYLDLIRSFVGSPRGVYARTVRHPKFKRFASTRSSMILDYGDMLRCCLSINHCHPFGTRHQDATFRIEGVDGAAVTSLGLLLDYPTGAPSTLEVIGPDTDDWVDVPLEGAWFPDGFIGSMSSLQRYAAGEDDELPTSVEDAFETMSLVEACYTSDAEGAVPFRPEDPS